jgi:hypothetical protein
MPYLGPQNMFLFEKCCLKSDHFFGAALYSKDTSRGCRKGDVHRQENFGLVRG